MSAAQLPILYVPLAWVGVIGTSLTYSALARAHVDLSRLLTVLKIRDPFTLAVSLYGVWTLAVAGVFFYLLGKHGIPAATVGLEGSLSLGGAALALGGAVLGIGLWPLLERIARVFGGTLSPTRSSDPQKSNGLGAWDLVLLTTFGAIAVPALEEFMFRGYVLTVFQQRASSPTHAVVLTSLIFAGIHFVFGRGMVVYAFFSSLMLCRLCLLSGNLYPAMLMHSLVNFFAFVAAPVLFQVPLPSAGRGQRADP